jgi:hypothetical protein
VNAAQNAKSTGNAPAQATWAGMQASDFDAAAPLTLFDMSATDNSMQLRKPDKCGTPDLFSDWA